MKDDYIKNEYYVMDSIDIDKYELNIPSFLAESIYNFKKATNEKSSLLDCYFCELNSSINVCEVENIIPTEQADYLRKKYLWK